MEAVNGLIRCRAGPARFKARQAAAASEGAGKRKQNTQEEEPGSTKSANLVVKESSELIAMGILPPPLIKKRPCPARFKHLDLKNVSMEESSRTPAQVKNSTPDLNASAIFPIVLVEDGLEKASPSRVDGRRSSIRLETFCANCSKSFKRSVRSERLLCSKCRVSLRS